MFGPSNAELEHQIEMLKIEVDDLKMQLNLRTQHIWEIMGSDWMCYMQSRTSRFLNNIKSECLLTIARETPTVSTCMTFRGGPASFTYKKLSLIVELCGLDNNLAKYSAIYDGGDLPEPLAKELFEYATIMYNSEKNRTKENRRKKNAS